MSFAELEQKFDISGINKSPSIFDPMKLAWLNSLYIKEMTAEDFASYATPWIENCPLKNFDKTLVCKLIQSRIETFAEIEDKLRFLWEFDLSTAICTSIETKNRRRHGSCHFAPCKGKICQCGSVGQCTSVRKSCSTCNGTGREKRQSTVAGTHCSYGTCRNAGRCQRNCRNNRKRGNVAPFRTCRWRNSMPEWTQR